MSAAIVGSRLVPADGQGSLGRTIRCPYHSWAYSLDGRLRTAPFLEESDGLDKTSLALSPVGIDCWGGFFFLNLSPQEAALRHHDLPVQLGLVPERLCRYPLAQLRGGKRLVYEVAANWKVILENYNECYHCGPVHPELCRLVPAFKQRGGSELDWDRGIRHREGAWTFTETGTTSRRPFEGLNADEQVRHKGELIYPNFMISLSADHVTAYTLWPRGPQHTSIVCDFLFHPSEIARAEFDPADAVNFWDLVNRQDWTICENVQCGLRSRMFQQAGTTVKGAYDVFVSMSIISYFIPYLFMFASLIRLQREPPGFGVIRVPGGAPVAMALGTVGLTTTAAAICLALIPAGDEPSKWLAVTKVAGLTLLLLGGGSVVYFSGKKRQQD